MCESLRKKEKNVRAALEEALSCSRGRTRESSELTQSHLEGAISGVPRGTHHRHLPNWPSKLPPEIVARDCFGPPESDHAAATPLGRCRQHHQRHPSRCEVNKTRQQMRVFLALSRHTFLSSRCLAVVSGRSAKSDL